MTNILRLPDIKVRTGLSRTTIYSMIKVGKFPAQIQIGKRAVGWDSRSIDAWIERCIEKSGRQVEG